jgi:DNA-binding SARP family transcriptional activator/predicted negative regulator of RcsB-dependent stress response
VEFRILGPLEVEVGSEALDLRGVRQQIVLAMLLLNEGKVVTVDRLLEAVYGEDLPPTGRSQAQMSVSSLRRLFAEYGQAGAISTGWRGYVLQLGEGRLDRRRFAELEASARAARDAGNPDRAVAHYRDALRLWRGPALEGIDSQLIRAAASRLDEQRIAVIQDRLTLELDLGRHHELVGELAELVREYPLREELRGKLMLALYRCGRAAEALTVYQEARRTFVDELGIEPSEPLQRLEHAILNADPMLDPRAGPVSAPSARRPAPCLLPAGIADFTGRARQVEQIQQSLLRADGQQRDVPPVVVITGRGGAGKTSLAVHTAHRLAREFADGQLFADLHGGGAHPTGPMQVLERFLRALGVPGPQVPEGLDARAEMYRNLLSGREMLVVLDDAAGESQVTPLLPGSGTAAVIVTGRSRLAGLAGATRVELDVLGADQSVQLLARIVGAHRVLAQPEAAAAVAEQCGHLPLALRIAGARLADRPHWDIQHLARRLADEAGRLDELRHGDLAVRATISVSYDSASKQGQRLLRRLALLDAPVFSGWVSAPLLNQPGVDADDALDELVAARLAEAVGTGRGVYCQYRLHDLIRMFARERLAAEETAAERAAATERALGALLSLAEAANRRYYGGGFVLLATDAPRWPLPAGLTEQLVADPLAWYKREHAALMSGIRQAAQRGLVGLCWSLAKNANTYFATRAHFDDWREISDIALAATDKEGDVRGHAAMLYDTAELDLVQGRFEQARRGAAAAAQLFHEASDDRGAALATTVIASLDLTSGRLGDAATRYEQALTILQSTGDHVSAAHALQCLAGVNLQRNKADEAMEMLAEALRLVQEAGNARIEAQVLYRMGEAYLVAGDPVRAGGTFELALAKVRELSDPIGQAYILHGIGVAKTRQAEPGQARDALQRAMVVAGTTGERLIGARALLALAELALTCGDPGQAVVLGQQSARALAGMGAELYESKALALLSDAHAALGDSAAAEAAAARAAAIGLDPADDAASA